MIDVEGYSLLLLIYLVIGFELGIGYLAVEAQQRGGAQRLDLVYLIGNLLAIGYGIYGLKFIWHERFLFVGVMPIINIFVGALYGNLVIADRRDTTIKVLTFATYLVVPITYGLFLP